MIEFIDSDGWVYGSCDDYNCNYIRLEKNGSEATLDGAFTVAHLEKILTKMKELQGERHEYSR